MKGRIVIVIVLLNLGLVSAGINISTIESSGTVGLGHAIAVLDNQTFYISHINYSSVTGLKLHFANTTNRGESWSTKSLISQTNITYAAAYHTNIDAVNDSVFITFSNMTTDSPTYIYVMNSTNGGISWDNTEVAAGLNGVNLFKPYIHALNKSHLYLTFTRGSSSPNLSFSHSSNGGASWTTSHLDTKGGYSVIHAVNTSHIYMASQNSGYKLNFTYTNDSGSNWGTINVDSDSGYPSMYVVNASLIYISYIYAVMPMFNTELRLAKSINGGSSWTTSTVDSYNISGRSSITGFGADDIFISYRNTTSGGVSHYKMANSSNGGDSWDFYNLTRSDTTTHIVKGETARSIEAASKSVVRGSLYNFTGYNLMFTTLNLSNTADSRENGGGAVPEWEDYAILLILITVIGGFFAMRREI